MTTTTVSRSERLEDLRFPAPVWWARTPEWLRFGGFLVLVCVASVGFRSLNLAGQYWMDEGITVGISSHPLTAIPGILRMDGSPPLFYLLLHLWMSLAGTTEVATHSFTLLIATLCIPIAFWGAWTLFDRRTAVFAAVLFGFNGFITQYGVETRMYVLMTLLGLLGTIGFLHGFVNRRRGYVILFALSLALMLYTHSWALFFGGSCALAVIYLLRIGDPGDRKLLLMDALMAFVGAAILYLPWLPTFLWQAAHTAAPWDSTPHFGAPVQLSRNVMGGDRVTMAVVIPSVVGLAGLTVRANRMSHRARLMWVLLIIAVGTLLLAWVASHVTPAWVPRYFAPMVPSLLFLAAFGMSRAGLLGVAGLVLSLVFLANPGSYSPSDKSDMKDVAAEVAPMLHRGDLVIMGQPEQTPLAYFYLPGGLRFANTIGPVRDPSFMNWVDALQRFQNADPAKVLPPLLNSLKPGQQVVFIRPLTEGAKNWEAPWTSLVRRRAAQWSAIIAADKQLKQVFWAPHHYNEACCVADSAILYKKV